MLSRKLLCLPVFAYIAVSAIPADAQPPDEKPVSYWVTQLGHDHYLRREMASDKLIAAGPGAVDELAEVTRGGDLEVVERAAAVITAIALAHAPNEDGGAWDSLSKMASESGGRRASTAKSALNEIRDHRAIEARKALAGAGIFVGVDEFAIGAISRPLTIVQIDDKWHGDADSLQWLAWLSGVENARVKGSAVRGDVLSHVTKIPGLETLVIIDGKMDKETLKPLIEMDRIQSLEFRYVELTDEQAEMIASIPIRLSLNLMGTGVSESKVASMAAELPGLQITHRQGGFLGVSCLDGPDQCEISSVVPGSAAEEAGLMEDDVIIGVGDTEVTKFKDLQDAINQHVPGDEVEVRYRRGEEVHNVKLRLRRLEES